jgi:hypothetical protein
MTTFAGSYFPASYFPPGWSSAVESDPGALLASVSGSALAAGSLTARGYLFGAIAASASVQAFITQASGEIVAILAGSASVSATLGNGNVVRRKPVVFGEDFRRFARWPRYVSPDRVFISAALDGGRARVRATATAAARLAAQVSGAASVSAEIEAVDWVAYHNEIAFLLAA